MDNKVLESLRLKNFITHKNTYIEFKSGINYIVGPEGSGKSLILEAISFCFFGSVALRGVASSYKQVELELIFNYLGTTFKVIRKISDAILYIQDEDGVFIKTVVGTTSVNQKIISLFGYDYSIYVLSNYCQQNELQAFSKLTPAKKLSFIDKVSGVEDAKEFIKFLEARKKALRSEILVTKKHVIPPVAVDESLLGIDYSVELEVLETKKKSLLNNTVKTFSLQKEILACTVELNKLRSVKRDPQLQALFEEYGESFYVFADALEQYFDDSRSLKQLTNEWNHIRDEYYFEVPYTLEQLEQFYLDVEYNKLVVLKRQFLANELITCPSCTHSFRNTTCSFDIESVGDELLPVPRVLDGMYTYVTKYKERDVELVSLIDELKGKLNPLFEKVVGSKDTFVRTYTQYVNSLQSDLITIQDIEAKLEVLNQQLELVSSVDTSIELEAITNSLYNLTKNKLEVEVYLQSKLLYDTATTELIKLESELSSITSLITDCVQYSEDIKKEAIPLINHHASVLLNNMTESVLSKLMITDTYDMFVDSKNINVCCGSEKDTASLAFRLSLGNSIILGMLPLFLGDEIDSSSRMERSILITDVLQNMSELGYQVLLITHKDTSNFENCNIIDLQEIL